MGTLNDLVHAHTELEEADVEWLHQLVGDWQLLSDLAFADLVLWVLTPEGWLTVAHVRPTTGATVFFQDVVGEVVASGEGSQLDDTLIQGQICRDRDPQWHEDVPVREETIPVVRDGRTIAVLSRVNNLATMRSPTSAARTP